jgi:hypothetical protein
MMLTFWVCGSVSTMMPPSSSLRRPRINTAETAVPARPGTPSRARRLITLAPQFRPSIKSWESWGFCNVGCRDCLLRTHHLGEAVLQKGDYKWCCGRGNGTRGRIVYPPEIYSKANNLWVLNFRHVHSALPLPTYPPHLTFIPFRRQKAKRLGNQSS